MILGMALLLGTVTGEVTFYGRGVMERTYRNRLAWGHVEPCAECVGMAALVGGPEHLGKRIWLQRPGRTAEGPFLVVDCSNAAHVARQRALGRVAEVDWRTARRWGMRGPLEGVRVLFNSPAVDATVYLTPSRRRQEPEE